MLPCPCCITRPSARARERPLQVRSKPATALCLRALVGLRAYMHLFRRICMPGKGSSARPRTGCRARQARRRSPDCAPRVAGPTLSVGSSDGSYVEGARKGLAVMVKDSKKYASTGGWGFQLWAGGDPKKPQVTDAAKQC